MKRYLFLIVAMIVLLTGCSLGGQIMDEEIVSEEPTASQPIHLKINDAEVPVSWEQNASVEELRTLLPLTISLHMYEDFEQVGPLGTSLVSEDTQTTTDAGDIVLYSGDQIVLFYGSNSWAYTRLGHIDLTKQEISDLLANGDVRIQLYE